jgi:hypothetical protein
VSPLIPEGPVEYIIYRLQGHWEIPEHALKEISDALYKMKDPPAHLIALQLDELKDDQLELLLPYLPSEVTTHLDDIPL